jgi:hypothetical protein
MFTLMQRYLLLQVPVVLLAVMLVVVFVGAALLGMSFVRRRTEFESLEAHKDVAGFLIAVVGALYSVLLAFVVVSVWESFEDAERVALRESELVVSLYRDADAFPSDRESLRTSIRGYAESVVDDEWPSMAEDQREAPETDVALSRVFNGYRTVDPQGPAEDVFLRNALDRLDDVTESRRERIAAAATELPRPLWTVLLAGCVITIGFTLLFPVRNARVQAVMVGALAAMTALMLFLVLSLDLPFTGDLAVKPTAMNEAIAEFGDLDRLDTSGAAAPVTTVG